jgi:hypothetical protein
MLQCDALEVIYSLLLLGVGSLCRVDCGVPTSPASLSPTLCCSQPWRSVAIPPSRASLRVPDLWHGLWLHNDGVAPLHDDTAVVVVGMLRVAVELRFMSPVYQATSYQLPATSYHSAWSPNPSACLIPNAMPM